MIRKLAIALSLLGACFTGFVHALGLGEVTVKSALNQPLNAEIELVNTAGLTINEILPGLATREEFQKANVDRVYFLSDLRFEVMTGTQGKAVIVLTSKKPVREPYLNFIVELIWPSGRLLREYALLIDPPLFSEQPVAQVSSPKTNSEHVVSGDVLTISSSTGSVSSRPLLAPVRQTESGTYGATSANDTLWDIALKARPDRSVSPQQVMLAIQELNPDAFIDNNINKLKAGHVLRLPSIDQIKQRSQHQAIQGVIAQNEALSGKRTPSIADGSRSTSPKVKSQAPKTNITGDALKLIVSDSDASATTNSANSGQSNQSGSGASNELALALEKLDKTSIENKELNSRLSDLEEQLSTLQRLLTLKNDQLSSIQSQMRANEIEKLKVQESSGALASDASKISDEVVDTKMTEDSSLGKDQATASQNVEDQIKDMQPVNAQEPAMSETDVAPLATPVAEKLEAQQLVSKNTEPTNTDSSKTQMPVSQNFIEMIISNPIYLAISVVSVLVLVFLLWLVSRHNAKREEEFQAQNNYVADDAFDQEALDQDSEADINSQDQDLYENVEDNLDASEYEQDFTEELEDESQDVLAEVNAYISYGRLDQAAEVLENAISQEPVRTDYRLKLLTIYKELGDRQAFDRQFSELEAIQDSTALAAADKIKQDMLEEAHSLEAETEDHTLTTSQDVEAESTEEDVDSALEAELSSFNFDSVSLEETDDIDLTSELDLDDLELDASNLDDGKESLSLVTDESLEVDDVLDLEDVDSITEDFDTSDFDDSILDVDLEDLDLNAELDQESEIALSEDMSTLSEKNPSAPDAELVVSDDILEEAAQAFEEDDKAMSLDADLADADEFDFLNGTDEASTKLDLARAYIDMGDIEGAKDILLEVTKEGSEAQQTEAKDLLESID